MKITYEDRKNKGTIDSQPLAKKPIFSFEYAWFLVTGTTAQYVESHEEGVWNKDMTDEMKAEVIEFYTNYIREPDTLPTYDADTQKLVESGIEVVDGLNYKKYIVEDLTEEELERMKEFSRPIPNISLRQCRELLIRTGRFDDVVSILDSLPTTTPEEISTKKLLTNYWEYSTEFERAHKYMSLITDSLGMSEDEIDSFFIEASKL